MPSSFSLDELGPAAIACYVAAGMSGDDAVKVVDNQLWADLRGVDTHGLWRLPWYVGWFNDGTTDPTAHLTVVHETASSLAADGHSGLGQLVITQLIDRLIAKANDSGIVVGTIRNSNDWGCGAYYPYKAAEAGFLCIATTTSVPNLAPFGSRRRLFGNNPMVFTVPRRDERPLVLDFALTPVALGKVMRARDEGATLPLEWGFRDNDGLPTTDPAVALKGVIPAIGGYKGTGLAMMTNVLAGILSGSSHTTGVRIGHRGQFFVLLDPGLFGERERFFDEIEDMVTQIRRAGEEDVLPGSQVYLPGEIEEQTMAERRRAGRVTYPDSVIEQIRATASGLGVAFPDGVPLLASG